MSRPKTVLNAATYSGMVFSLATTSAPDFWPISTGLRIGHLAWSSRVAARPSQNSLAWNMAFSTVGLLRAPCWPPTPAEVAFSARWSVKPLAGSWQVAQATVPSDDRRLSLNKVSPSLICAAVGGVGTVMSYKPAETPGGRLAGASPANAVPG